MVLYYFLAGWVFCGLSAFSQSLLFTEIMYDPPASCPEYLEITNLDMKDGIWEGLQIEKNGNNPVKLEIPVMWPSGESRVITSDRKAFKNCFDEVDTALVFETDLFALNNTGASLALLSTHSTDQAIDHVSYSPSDHNELFTSTKGVALERNTRMPLNNKWRSGFVQFGYRSPGFLPQWDENVEVKVSFSTNKIYLEAGREPSLLEIKVYSGEADGSVTIEVYDLNGRKVKIIANAVPLQGGELFSWKGQSKSGQILPEGLYLFRIYYFNVKGQKRIFKKTCVLLNR